MVIDREPRFQTCTIVGGQRVCEPEVRWYDVTDDFDVLIAPAGCRREVWVARRLDGDGLPVAIDRLRLYRVRPRINAVDGLTELRSDDTQFPGETRDDPEVVRYSYYANLTCFDLNMNMALDEGDIEAWADVPVDFTDDGLADADDLDVLVDAIAGG